MNELITRDVERLKFHECDYKKRMRISSMLKITAELAGFDYEQKGLDYDFLQEHGFAFLLSRISLNIIRYPLNQETLSCETWERGKKGAMFMRGYNIIDEKGEICVNGTSGWILINPQTRHILKPSEFPFPFPQLTDVPITAKSVGKIVLKDAIEVGCHKVCISDLDANGHVYNAFYADIASNFLSNEEFERDVENFRINFVSEAKQGQIIRIYKKTTESCTVIIGKIEEKVCFESEFIWR